MLITAVRVSSCDCTASAWPPYTQPQNNSILAKVALLMLAMLVDDTLWSAFFVLLALVATVVHIFLVPCTKLLSWSRVRWNQYLVKIKIVSWELNKTLLFHPTHPLEDGFDICFLPNILVFGFDILFVGHSTGTCFMTLSACLFGSAHILYMLCTWQNTLPYMWMQ